MTISHDLALAAGKYFSEGCTVIYVAIDDVLAGYVVLADTVRKESAAMIQRIHTLGVQPVLLTGDNQNAVSAIGKQHDPDFSDWTVVDFSDLAQGCKTYAEFIGKMKEVS